MPGRLDSRPLRLSQRSNALQFYNFSTYSDQLAVSKSRSYYLYTDPRPSPIADPPSKKQYAPQTTTAPPRNRTISSLVTPFIPAQATKSKRTNGSIKKQDRSGGRLVSSSASIRSIASSVISRMKRYAQPPTLETLPSEILNQIFSYLDQRTLHSLIFCSKKLLEEASYNLYECPRFATTYRFAQFVTTITHDRHRAWMVKEFDVSNLGKSSGPEDEKSLAGWREWKFRSDPLHTIHRDDYGSGGVAKRTGGKKSTHPPPSPFLQRYSYIRDIPIGAVLHALAACPLIKRIDLSNVPLAADYFVSSLGSYRTAYYPTAFTGLLFVSDVPKSFTWKEGDTQPVLSNNDLVDAVTKLQSLQSIGLRGGLWVTRDVAERLVMGAKSLQSIDLRECGMYKQRKWTIRGSKYEVWNKIEEEKTEDAEKEMKGKEEKERRRRLAGIF